MRQLVNVMFGPFLFMDVLLHQRPTLCPPLHPPSPPSPPSPLSNAVPMGKAGAHYISWAQC